MLSPNSRSLWVIIIINIGVPSITHRRKNSGHCLKSLTTQPTFSNKKVRGHVDLRVKSQNFIRIANVVQSHSLWSTSGGLNCLKWNRVKKKLLRYQCLFIVECHLLEFFLKNVIIIHSTNFWISLVFEISYDFMEPSFVIN